VSPKKLVAFRLDQALVDALAAIKERDGVPLTEQVTRAVKAWIETKHLAARLPTKRPVDRKPSRAKRTPRP
jgi:hypothetical protein